VRGQTLTKKDHGPVPAAVGVEESELRAAARDHARRVRRNPDAVGAGRRPIDEAVEELEPRLTAKYAVTAELEGIRRLK
jgi:hypothetical protein